VRSYDRQKGQPNGAAIPWKGRHIHVRLSPDGSTLMVRTEELESATLSQYDPITGLTIGPSIPVHRVGMPLVFSSSSRALAIADWENIRCWDMPGPMAGPVEHIRLWSEIMSRRAFVAEPVETQTLLDDRAVGLKKKQLREQWGGAPIPAQK
jgi:hypothetical protein